MIINADDFGHSAEVNSAILESFQRRWISSTTLMATMPGFEEACQLAHEHALLEHIGLHFVLTEGTPLTDRIRRCPRLCDANGRLHFRIARSTLRLAADEREAVAGEMVAQITRCRKSGVPLTHTDSHHHIHTAWGVGTIVAKVARSERIPFVRLSRNCGKAKSLVKRIYTAAYNGRLRRRGLARTRWFGSIDDYVFGQSTNGFGDSADIEIMVHPLRNAHGMLFDKVPQADMAAAIQQVRNHEQAVSFSGHRYSR